MGLLHTRQAPPYAEAIGHVQTASCNAVTYVASIPYSVTAGFCLKGNTHRLLPVLSCLWLLSDPGSLPSATIIFWGLALIRPLYFRNCMHGFITDYSLHSVDL